MKTLEELRAIKVKMQNRFSSENPQTRIVVGLATCGIAAGAKPVLDEFAAKVKDNNLSDKVVVSQTGCIGLCQFEPIVEVFVPGQKKVTYIKMDAAKADEVFEQHIVGGQIVDKYTMASSGLK